MRPENLKKIAAAINASSPVVPDVPSSATPDVRESMTYLPRWSQEVLTWITGKPLANQQPMYRWTWKSKLAVAVSLMAASVLGGVVLATSGPAWWALLPFSWLLTVSAARSFQTTFIHHASHNALSGSKRLDRVIGETLSVVGLLQPLSLYTEDHGPHHGYLATTRDPDLLFLKTLGFDVGNTMAAYRRQFMFALISPRFHSRFLRARVRANFLLPRPWRRAAAAAWWIALLGAATMTGTLGILAIVWLVPILVVYHWAALGQLLTEHSWVRIGEGRVAKRVVMAKLTAGRFFGEAAPSPSLPPARFATALTRWVARMLLWHLPTRLLFVQLDLSQHDWHHRYASARSLWPNAAYARRDDELSGSPGWPPYTETWGMKAALDRTFTLLSQLPASSVLGDPPTYATGSDDFMSM